MSKRIQTKLKNLLLDQDNIRTGSKTSQRDAFLAMLDEQGSDLVDIAKHVCEKGLAPYRLPIVIPAKEKGVHIVIDGNRRISAINLVKNPSLATDRA